MKRPIFLKNFEPAGDARLRDMVNNTSSSDRGWREAASRGIFVS
jgi:hypothetical protein